MHRGFAGFCLVAVLACALRLPVAGLPLERDEGEYAYIAWRWAGGGVPYLDSFNQKPPATPAVYRAILATLGESPSAIRWGAQLWTLAWLATLMALARRWFGGGAALAAGIVAALLGVDRAFLGNSANTELFALLPLCAGTLAVAARRGAPWALAAGLCGGAALLFKPIAVAIVLLHGVALAGRRHPLTLVCFALGVLAPLGATAGYLAARHALGEFWQDAVVLNWSYATDLPLSKYPALLTRVLLPSVERLWPLAVTVVLGTGVALREAARRGERREGARWTLAWLAAAALAASAGGYFRAHYFLLAVPPLALAAGLALDTVARRIAPRVPGAAALGALGLVAFAVATSPWYYLSRDLDAKTRGVYQANPFGESLLAAQVVRELSAPDDEVFVYGSEPQVLYYARRRSATRYILAYAWSLPLPGADARQREALAEIERRRPKLVVATFQRASFLPGADTPRILEDGLRRLLDRSYRLVAVVAYDESSRGSLLAEDAARRAWSADPQWGQRRLWAAFAIWERVDPEPAPPGDA